MRCRLFLSLAGAAAAGLLLAAPGASAASSCPDAQLRPLPSLTTPSRVEASILCLINQARADRRLVPLRGNLTLQAAAREHSTSMAAHDLFAHESPDGTPFTTRLLNGGYMTYDQAWQVGENIAWGSFSSPKALVAAWMASPEHRMHILGRYREIGVGVNWGHPLGTADPEAVVATADFGWVNRGAVSAARKAKKRSRRMKRGR